MKLAQEIFSADMSSGKTSAEAPTEASTQNTPGNGNNALPFELKLPEAGAGLFADDQFKRDPATGALSIRPDAVVIWVTYQFNGKNYTAVLYDTSTGKYYANTIQRAPSAEYGEVLTWSLSDPKSSPAEASAVAYVFDPIYTSTQIIFRDHDINNSYLLVMDGDTIVYAMPLTSVADYIGPTLAPAAPVDNSQNWMTAEVVEKIGEGGQIWGAKIRLNWELKSTRSNSVYILNLNGRYLARDQIGTLGLKGTYEYTDEELVPGVYNFSVETGGGEKASCTLAIDFLKEADTTPKSKIVEPDITVDITGAPSKPVPKGTPVVLHITTNIPVKLAAGLDGYIEEFNGGAFGTSYDITVSRNGKLAIYAYSKTKSYENNGIDINFFTE